MSLCAASYVSDPHRLQYHTILCNCCYAISFSIVKNRSLSENQLKDNERGKSGLFQNQITIIIRNTDPMDIQRYTIAHEIGHILIGKDSSEYEAERFAIGVLAPACVLWGLDIHEPEDISRLCNISITSAKIRAERMKLLYKREQEFLQKYGRSCFLQLPLDQKVYKQFQDFIGKYKELE